MCCVEPDQVRGWTVSSPPPRRLPKSRPEASIAETHVLNARMTSEMEKLVQAEAEMAEMDRMSSELVAYSSGLHDLLAKMHALER